jgi:hypothetical protein
VRAVGVEIYGVIMGVIMGVVMGVMTGQVLGHLLLYHGVPNGTIFVKVCYHAF